MRTDLIFKINREMFDRLQPPRKKKRGWLVVLVLAGAVAAFVYLKMAGRLDEVNWARIPFVAGKEQKVDALVSRAALLSVVGHSELTRQEKASWKAYIDEVWAPAVKRDGPADWAGSVVGSYAGLYYALLLIDEQGFADTALKPDQRKLAGKLIAHVTADMRGGRYASEQLIPLKGPACHVAGSIGRAAADDARKQETDRQRRELCSALYRLDQAKVFDGAGNPVDMPALFRVELEAFKRKAGPTAVP